VRSAELTDPSGGLGRPLAMRVEEARAIATINGAFASSEENLKGAITSGKLADFVMLERDPQEWRPMLLRGTVRWCRACGWLDGVCIERAY
jgi:predicted amidohydrolase YtcJ